MIGPSHSESAKPRTSTAGLVGADVNRFLKQERAGAEKQGSLLIGAGLVGAALAALCCATPLLAALLPAVGLGAWLAGANWILLFLLVVGVGVSALVLFRCRAQIDACFETETKKRI